MERMFTREDIDFDKLHGEIKQNLLRQKELRSKGIKPSLWGSNYGNAAKWNDWNELHSQSDWHKVGVEERELGYLTVRITVLCSILSYAKGKSHFTKLHKSYHKYNVGYHNLMLDDQILHERVFGDEWKEFIKVGEPVVVSDGLNIAKRFKDFVAMFKG